MTYEFKDLMDLETAIIELEPLCAVTRAVCYSAPEMHQIQVQNALYNITDQWDEKRGKLREIFDILWEKRLEEIALQRKAEEKKAKTNVKRKP